MSYTEQLRAEEATSGPVSFRQSETASTVVITDRSPLRPSAPPMAEQPPPYPDLREDHRPEPHYASPKVNCET